VDGFERYSETKVAFENVFARNHREAIYNDARTHIIMNGVKEAD
jgi:hypothetical protein